MKEKLNNIRSLVEKLADLALEVDESEASEYLDTILDDLESFDALASHVDDFDDFDIESWSEDLRHIIEEHFE